MRNRTVRQVVILIALVAILGSGALTATAGRSEFGVAIPISATFSFTSFSYGLEAYYRWAGSLLALEAALHTNFGFSSLYIRDTLATAGALFLCVGHVTNLLPHFGSTYFTAGLGFAIGNAWVLRTTLNLALSVGYGFYAFPELRFQFGFDP
jgi:hypothetical protein